MKYLLLLLTIPAFANYVTGPDAQTVYADKAACEAQEFAKCYFKDGDHTLMKIEDDKLVIDPVKVEAKQIKESLEELDKEVNGNAKKAKMIEIREMMKKSSLTNAEMKKVIRLLLEHLGHLEAE